MSDIDFEELGARMANDTNCAECGQRFEPSRSWARFCSAKCRTDWHATHTGIKGIVESVTQNKRSVTMVVNFPTASCSGAAKFKAGMPIKVTR